MTTRRAFIHLAAAAGGAAGAASVVGPGALYGAPPGVPARKLRILILGGTAFTGPYQIRYALARGHEVTIFNRGRTEPTVLPEVFDQVEKLVGDRDDDLGTLEGRTWDAVIDNSASLPRWVQQTCELLTGSVQTYLFTSSLSVHAEFGTPGLTEDAPVAVIDDPTTEEITGESYGALKAMCEQEVRDSFPDGAIIVRPHLIVGPGDRTDRWTYWALRVQRGGEVLAPGAATDPTQYIDARDLAEFGIRLVEQRALGTFSAVGPLAPLTMAELLFGMRAVVSNDVSFTWVPADFLAEHEVAPWAEMTAWMPADGEYAGFGLFDNSRAVEAGLTYRPLAETTADTLSWWAGLPAERTNRLRAGLAPDKEVEVLAAWHAQLGVTE